MTVASTSATRGLDHQAQQQGPPPPPPPPLQPPPPATVRLYSHAADHARLAHICRNVYGGTDDLPQRVASLHSQPGTHLLAACTGGQEKQLDALLCCQQRGDVLWLFGARTAEELRGNGLAAQLLAEAEALARTLPGTAALLSITVPANRTMRRLFARRGLMQQRRVVAWPETPAAQDAHERMAPAVAEQQGHQQCGGAAALSFLQALPAVAAAADTPAAQELLPRWRRCGSVAELEVALLRLRQADPQRQQRHGNEGEDEAEVAALGAEPAIAPQAESQIGAASLTAAQTAGAAAAQGNAEMTTAAAAAVTAGGPPAAGPRAVHAAPPAALPATSCAFHWLPAEYELLPAGGAEAQRLVQQGAVWVLEPPMSAGSDGPAPAQQQAGASGEAHAAVLACLGPGFRGMRHAGIVAGSPAALESALLHASAVADPRCCRFYIDACGFDHPRLWASTGGPRTDIIPFCKPLAA